MKKILYVMEQPLDQRNYHRFGIQRWLDAGWAVEVWDLTPLTTPDAWRSFQCAGGEVANFEGYFSVAHTGDLASRFTALGPCGFYVDFLGNRYHGMKVKARLRAAGLTRITFSNGTIPEPPEDPRGGFWEKVLSAAGKGPGGLAAGVVAKLSESVVSAWCPPGIRIVSGERALRAARAAHGRPDILRAHNLDYDVYLDRLASDGDAAGEARTVFLDQDLCFHLDFAQVAGGPGVTPARYFPTICRGLRQIGAVVKAPPVIAAHPRSQYGQRGRGAFEKIPISFDTFELVRRSAVVVCHNSAAIQLAVLFRKPIIFVTTRELSQSISAPYIDAFASTLDKTVINLDEDLTGVDWACHLRVDEQLYASYKREFIKTDGSPEEQSWQIVIRHAEAVISQQLST